MRLLLDVQPTLVSQGSDLRGYLTAELGGESLVACELVLRLPSGALTGVRIHGDAFSQPGDTFDWKDVTNGTYTVAATAANSICPPLHQRSRSALARD